MSRILILDDDSTRHEHFRKLLPDCNRTHTYTAQEAIWCLQKNDPFDLVLLDHDLGDYPTPGENIPLNEVAGTGQEVAEFIALHLERDRYPKKIIIHSWNAPASKNMLETLKVTQIPVEAIPFKAAKG
jgi:hypothetical protein